MASITASKLTATAMSLGFCIAAYIPTAAIAAAAPATDSPAVLEEVIVTAKQRSEPLQEVPLSISAFTADALRKAQILDVRDLANRTPGLNFASGAARADPSAVALRGVTANTSDERYQGVSIFIDGVALSGQLASLDLRQLQQVEILKGPQSATFGRATYSGAINYITRDLNGSTPSGGILVRGGQNEDAEGPNYYLGADFTLPILQDRLWLGVQATQFGNGGLYKDPQDGSDIGEERTQAAAVSVFFQATDALSFKGRASFDYDEDSAAPRHIQHPREWVAAGVPTVQLSRAGGALWPTSIPDASPGYTASLDEGIGRPLDGGFERERTFASLITRYDWSGFALSYSIGLFRSIDWRVQNFNNRSLRTGIDPVFGSLIGTAVALNPLTTSATASLATSEEFENISHQFLVVSPGEKRLRWRAGLYYFEERDLNYAPAFATAVNPSGKFSGVQKIQNVAAFGGVDLDVTDRITLGLEGRYQEESLDWGACPVCIAATARKETRDESDLLPRITAAFQITPDNLVYALYSKGTKSGRLSNLSVVVGGQPDFVYARPEELQNYEVGSKNEFLGGRAILNVALYRSKVIDQHLVSTQEVLTSLGSRIITAAFNVGESRVNGFEVEANVRPVDEWSFGLGVGYADQEFTNAAPATLQAGTAVTFPGAAGSPVSLKGHQQANVPTWNGYVSVDYSRPIGGNGVELGIRVDSTYRGKFFGDLANIAAVPDSWKVNLRVAATRKDNWEAALYARNLLNDLTTPLTGLAGGTSTCTYLENDRATYGASQQCLITVLPRTREVGVELSYRF